MRKNKSVKDYSLGRNRKSQGKEISIELEPGFSRGKQNSHRGSKHLQNSQLSDRLDRSANPLSQNILKDIINYSHISHSNSRNGKGTTLASYDRHQDLMSNFNKINKKASLGQVHRRDQHKLVIDHHLPSNTATLRNSQFVNESKEIQMIESQSLNDDQHLFDQLKRQNSSRKNSMCSSISKSQLTSLQKQKSELTAKLDELQSIQEGIIGDYSQMIDQWDKMIAIQQNSSNQTRKLADIEVRRDSIKLELDSSNQILLNASRQFVISRRKFDQKGTGARGKVLDQAMFAHNEFMKKLTVRSFQQTLVFNMKVTIPDYKGKTSIRGIYEQLFHSRLAKKFVMLLKKYRNQMDLYDGDLLSQFTKRIIDLEGQYSRCQGQNLSHNDEPFLNKIELVVSNIDEMKSNMEETQQERNKILEQLSKWQQFGRQCQKTIHNLIDHMNSMVKGQYQRQTEKAADFKTLLTQKYTNSYKEFKRVKIEKEKTTKELQKVQCLLERLGGELF